MDSATGFVPPLPHGVSIESLPDHMSFHHAATFVGVWVLVFLAAPSVLSQMRVILEPLLWAFFIMMGLLPFTDFVEGVLVRAGELFTTSDCRRRFSWKPARSGKAPAALTVTLEESQSEDSDTFEEARPTTTTTGAGGCRQALGAVVGTSDEDDDDDVHQCQCARMTAVVVVVFCFFAAMLAFGYMVWASAKHMQSNWHHYEVGAKRLNERFQGFHDWLEWKSGDQVPKNVLDNTARTGLKKLHQLVEEGLGETLTSTSERLFEALMMMLYMMFWLCEPLHVGEQVSTLFRRYILLKGLASLMYALCVWLLLLWMSVDLAPFFGAVTFCFNWIPEVGPLFAMLLPLPVVLFDGRLEFPIYTMIVCLVGQLSLKFVFGNVVEVKLVEKQQDMHMHPVIILYSVAFFGWIWGATGMLLSVPIMAAFKATVSALPQAYRAPILTVMEGDKRAPERWERRQKKKLEQEERNSLTASEPSTPKRRSNTQTWWPGSPH